MAFAITGVSAGQTKAGQVQAIRKEFQAINGDSTMKIVRMENEEFMEDVTDGGGELTGYYKNGQVRKIRQWVGLSYGNEIREFYFRNGKLIFVYEQFNSFPYDLQKDGLDRTTTTTTFEGRYYFSNDKLVEQKTTGKRQLGDKSDPAAKLLDEASESVRLLGKKKD